jgi:RNA polymerase-associated protein RTF1
MERSNDQTSNKQSFVYENILILFKGISLPTLDDLDNKIKEIEKCKHYVYNNNDITKIVQEKKRFRRAPINYAVTKNELLKEIVC